MMPDSITSLGTYIFKNCSSLKKAHINEGRVNIMEGMFEGCKELEEVNIPSSVEYIRSSAFEECASLTSLSLPSALKEIEYNAFKNSGLKNIEYAGTAEQLGEVTISDNGNDSVLTNVINTLADNGSVVLKKEEDNSAAGTSGPQETTKPTTTNPSAATNPAYSSEDSANILPSYFYYGSSFSSVKKPKKVKLKKVKALGKRKVKISWKWSVHQDGYQLQYAVNRSFTKQKKTLKKSTYASAAVVEKLKKGKTYYFRVRAYNKANGKKKYGKWSNVKKVKAK
jgi:hypothetical protein